MLCTPCYIQSKLQKQQFHLSRWFNIQKKGLQIIIQIFLTIKYKKTQIQTKNPTKPTKQQQQTPPPSSPQKRKKSGGHKFKSMSKNKISCKMRLNNHSTGETLTINLEQYTIFCVSISNKIFCSSCNTYQLTFSQKTKQESNSDSFFKICSFSISLPLLVLSKSTDTHEYMSNT